LQSVRKRKRAVQLEDHLHDPRPDPFARAAAQSDLDAVHDRIVKLPEQDRSAFLMRTTEGMSYDEIARTLGISVASAKVKVHRARLTLSDIR
jgi:RNA polymerase sigma-70 factor (ECF subfamily)